MEDRDLCSVFLNGTTLLLVPNAIQFQCHITINIFRVRSLYNLLDSYDNELDSYIPMGFTESFIIIADGFDCFYFLYKIGATNMLL